MPWRIDLDGTARTDKITAAAVRGQRSSLRISMAATGDLQKPNSSGTTVVIANKADS